MRDAKISNRQSSGQITPLFTGERPTSAPPSEHIFIPGFLAEEQEEPLMDPRIDPSYGAFFYARHRLDPRLPPPIYSPGQSWQQVSPALSRVVGSNHASLADDEGGLVMRKKLVDRIQEDFPRTPSPVYSTSRVASKEEELNLSFGGLSITSISMQQKPRRKHRRNQQSYNYAMGIEPEPFVPAFPSMRLGDLRGNVLQWCCDQHGSRFIQQQLEHTSDQERTIVFVEVLPHVHKLATDVFANYVVQRLLEFCPLDQVIALSHGLRGVVLSLSLQMYGCRVVQKALEQLPPRDQSLLVSELEGHVLRLVLDQNGNHVVQKCLEVLAPSTAPFLVESFRGHMTSLAKHPYGCRVLQRVFEQRGTQSGPLIDELLMHVPDLVLDQYGNYVIQHILEKGNEDERKRIIEVVKGRVWALSQHKFASNVVEKCVALGNRELQNGLIAETLEGQPPALILMMRDQFANYVVQRMITTLIERAVHDELVISVAETVRSYLKELSQYPYAKHCLSKLQRLLSDIDHRRRRI